MTIARKINFDFNPSGLNSISSKSKFFQRLSYDIVFEMIIADKKVDRLDFFDTRDYFLYYGRLDNKKNIINISENNLKNIPDTRNMYAFNFVCDAYDDLRAQLNSQQNLGTIKDERFLNLTAKKGWSSVHTKYHEHIDSLFKIYLNFSKINGRHKTIIDFNSFLKNFITFIDKSANKTPFLKSSFVIGTDCNINDSGLVIEIDDSKKDYDEKKIKEYYEINDFYIFQNLAKKHGFAIDKECPWRLIFNVNSEFAVNYMSKYEVTKNNLFEKYYYKTANFDIENLKRYLIIIYNSIASQQETITVASIKNVETGHVASADTFIREQVSLESLPYIVPESFWFELYCYVFLIENRVKLSQKEYNLLITDLTNLNQYNFELVVHKLNNIADTYEKTNNKTFSLTYKLDR